MKQQDILYLVVLGFLIYKRNPNLFVWAGIFCFVLSIPLFVFWIFFTAQHLVWYGASFILIAVAFCLLREFKNL